MGRHKKLSISEDSWLCHVSHLASGLAYQKECKICHIGKVITTNQWYQNKDLLCDMTFFDEAVKSGRNSITEHKEE
jgi:hypothetical protein